MQNDVSIASLQQNKAKTNKNKTKTTTTEHPPPPKNKNTKTNTYQTVNKHCFARQNKLAGLVVIIF